MTSALPATVKPIELTEKSSICPTVAGISNELGKSASVAISHGGIKIKKPRALGRPVTAAQMAKYLDRGEKRDKPWLHAFAKEIDALKASGDFSNAGIWDELQRRHPIVPQFFEYTEARDKAMRIAVFLSRQRAKRIGFKVSTKPKQQKQGVQK